jgi:hypothetical protein
VEQSSSKDIEIWLYGFFEKSFNVLHITVFVWVNTIFISFIAFSLKSPLYVC